MRDKLRRLGIATAVIAAVAGTAVALPSAANARWGGGWHGGGWHGGHGGWGWGGFGVGLGSALLLGAATAPYYGGYYGYGPYAYGYGPSYAAYGGGPYYGVAAPSGAAGSGTVTGIACGGACVSAINQTIQKCPPSRSARRAFRFRAVVIRSSLYQKSVSRLAPHGWPRQNVHPLKAFR